MSMGIARERQFEVYVGDAPAVHSSVPLSFARLDLRWDSQESRRCATLAAAT